MKGYRLILAGLIFMLAGCATIGNGNNMKEYFVGYNYGMGGMWFLIWADSMDEITNRYPNIAVWEGVPDWMFIPPKSDNRYTDEMREQARRERPYFLTEMRKRDTYNIDKIPPLIHDVLLGEGFEEFIVGVKDDKDTSYFMIVAYNKKEISWRYPKLFVYESIPDFLVKNPDALEEVRTQNRYHIQNIPKKINQIFLGAKAQ